MSLSQTDKESMRSVVVRFRVPGEMAQLNCGDLDLARNDKVIVDGERGLSMATVLMQPEPYKGEEGLKDVVRRASPDDHEQHKKNQAKAAKALGTCRALLGDLDLELKLIEALYTHDAKRVTFFFTSMDRVDFRELVKRLARKLRCRVEMRQIGVRDAARFTGGIGICGRELCCSTWLPEFKPVSIRMAKDQNLALNHEKLSGLCGRLRCCLRYEQEVYKDAKKGLPKIGKRVITPQGEGRVKDLNVLKGRMRVRLLDGSYADFSTDEVSRPPAPEQQKAPPKELLAELKTEDNAAAAKPKQPDKAEPTPAATKKKRRRRKRKPKPGST